MARDEIDKQNLDRELSQKLVRADDRTLPLPDLDAALSRLNARVEQADRSLLGRLRALNSRSRLWIFWGAILVTSLATLVLKPRAELTAYPPARMALALLVMTALCAPLLQASLGAWQRPVSARNAALWVFGAWLWSLVLALLPEAHVLLPHTAPTPGHEVPQALACLGFGVALGVPVFVLCALLGRGAPYSALTASGAAGLTGNIALQLHCPINHSGHLVAGHSTVGLALLLLLGLASAAGLRARGWH